AIFCFCMVGAFGGLMKYPLRVLVAVASLITFGCTDTPSSPPTTPSPTTPVTTVPPNGPFTISGHVIDFSTGIDVQGFSFIVSGRTLTTDANGAYTVSLTRNDYDVQIKDASDPLGFTSLGYILAHASTRRSDFLINGGKCSVRYGLITDSKTQQ